MTLHETLADLVKLDGRSLHEIAAASGANRSSVYRAVRGTQRPSWDVLARLALALKLTPAAFGRLQYRLLAEGQPCSQP